ncbi:PH domain-containing protein [Rossellomorea vietnamensis]|uniref:PH domain-containing protein n=1 Tax=Rossellomorea vietnamensis TaxID=218284 RepID=A0A5D4MB27_9BACI|nr:PH domain-containing protein [Rossellomorea vietnamensis]TYR98513.1 PH domain-containing protein [Rossellomorea vietnamensis]
MSTPSRYHPLLMVFRLWKLVRDSAFFLLFLFVLKRDSDSLFIYYGKWVFLVIVTVSLISIPLKWLYETYAYDERAFYLKKGIFTKKEQTVPFSKVQNVNRHTSLLHRVFGLTSLQFDTASAGEDAEVKFEAVTLQEAGKLEELASRNEKDSLEESEEAAPKVERVMHFRPSKKDTIKASFISMSFLLLIPLLFSFYSKINDIWDVEEEATGIFSSIIGSAATLTIVVVVILIVSILLGVIRTYLKYGAYELSSDEDRIYIQNGVLELQSFSILKNRVQAVEIKQPLLKRWLGLAEVELVSAGQGAVLEDTADIKSLYPFLPTDRAYELISELLPGYSVEKEMTPLPLKSLWIRLVRPSWLWIIGTGVVYWWKPSLFGTIEVSWVVFSIVLLAVILLWRWLDFLNTAYAVKENFVQFKKGFFVSSIFVTKREKVIEVEVSQSRIQKLIGAASISTINRANPIRVEDVQDIPKPAAERFYSWYLGR